MRSLSPTVPERLRISRDELLRWAGTPMAHSEMPRLIRRLIANTCPDAERVDMPDGTAVHAGGWDGVVDCGEGNRFVPQGRSVWEISTQQTSLKRKANDDYDKRVKRTPAETRAAVSYVAVICAKWVKSREFEQQQSASGKFGSVRAYNAGDIADWLECDPATTVWLREKMDKVPYTGVQLLSRRWGTWLNATSPPLAESVVLAGRNSEAERLRARCAEGPGGLCTVGGSVTADEIAAFVAAALLSGHSEDTMGRDVLYVDDRELLERLLNPDRLALDSIGASRAPRLTVVTPLADSVQHLPVDSPHLLIVAMPGNPQAQLILGPVDGDDVAAAMGAAEVDFYRSREFGAMARMSLPALRRRLALNPEMHRPDWVSDRSVRRLLLVGRWHTRSAGDTQLLENFVGYPHEDLVDLLHATEPDPPMVLTNERWHAVSPNDAWDLISNQLTREDLDSFVSTAVGVLSSVDPYEGMGTTEALRAQYDGVRPEYSADIKRGVSTTVALLGARPAVVRGDAAPDTRVAAAVVARVLRDANDDMTALAWLTMCPYLSLLAEAAPNEVLEGLRACVAQRHPFIESLLPCGADDTFDYIPQAALRHVIAALEVLAWSPDHLLAAVAVMAELAAADTSSRGNKAICNSLASTIYPWYPRTAADSSACIEALEMLHRRHGETAWCVMVEMLDTTRAVISRRGPLYRDWKPSEPIATANGRQELIQTVASKLVEDAGSDPQRLSALASRVGHMPPEVFVSFRDALQRLVGAGPSDHFKSTLWPALRDMVARHREYQHTNWALPESELAPIDPILDLLRPADPARTYGWLFEHALVHIPGIPIEERDSHEDALKARRTQAVQAVLDSFGFDGVLALAEGVGQPHEVGRALDRTGANHDAGVISAMHDGSEALIGASFGYFRERSNHWTWQDVEALLAEHSPTPQVAADLLRALPPRLRAWSGVNDLGSEIVTEYWQRVGYYSLGMPDDVTDQLDVSRGLRAVGRTDDATWMLSMWVHRSELEPELVDEIADCLQERISGELEQDEPHTRLQQYDLTLLMAVLDRHRDHLGQDRVATIEWQYYPALRYAPDFSAPNLRRRLSQNPEFFVSLVELVYKPASASHQDRPEPSDAERSIMSNAWHLLWHWPSGSFAPGADAHSRLDSASLNCWIDQVRSRLARIDRADVGDSTIGTALAGAPADPDEDGPCEAVRDLIERIQSNLLESGFATALYNARGATSRSLTEGGHQERELADYYRDSSRQFNRWARTAAIYARLADDYEHMAATADREAEAHRREQPL